MVVPSLMYMENGINGILRVRHAMPFYGRCISHIACCASALILLHPGFQYFIKSAVSLFRLSDSSFGERFVQQFKSLSSTVKSYISSAFLCTRWGRTGRGGQRSLIAPVFRDQSFHCFISRLILIRWFWHISYHLVCYIHTGSVRGFANFAILCHWLPSVPLTTIESWTVSAANGANSTIGRNKGANGTNGKNVG